MSNCTQMRRKLLTHSSLNMATGETTPGKSEWVTEPCGVPIFGAKGETLCRSCLSGWTHPNNYPIADDGDGSIRCARCQLHPDMCTCTADHPLRQIGLLP